LSASASVRAERLGGCLKSSRSMSRWKRSRFSAISIMSGDVPMMGTPLASMVPSTRQKRVMATMRTARPATGIFSLPWSQRRRPVLERT
jgi:hypothetical protein